MRSCLAQALTDAVGAHSLCGALLLCVLAEPAHSQLFTIEEFVIPTAGSQPAVITRGPDGNLFFTESGADKIGRITPAGEVIDVATRGILTGLDGIAPDGLGNLWITESAAAGDHVIKANPSLSSFLFANSAPPPCSSPGRPRGIAAGPDGNMWVVLLQCNAIVKFPPAFGPAGGSVYTLTTTPNAGLARIAAGPDGALWFTESTANKIGRITTAGAITEYPIPTADSGPHGIAAGPDGALWFTELNANKIGRITIAGAITEYPIPTAGSGPKEIAAGPDGALWFTEFNSNKLGRITVSGAITEYPVPTAGSAPNGITAGPLGSVWFTEFNGNKVGRIRVAQPPRNDFDGDGRSDVLWRNAATGENYLYPMNGTTILPGEGYLRAVTDLDWQVAGIGDFDGDGKSDILWRNRSSGQNYVYFMDGTAIKASEGYIRTVADQSWRVAGTGDFDGDGRDDILWSNDASGENYLYLMNEKNIVGEGYFRTVADLAWRIAGVGDFDGDGKSDILWRNSSTGENYLYLMNATNIVGEGYLRAVADQDWQVAGVGDFNGDGASDILWRHRMSGENYLYPMNGTAILGTEGYLRTVADTAWQVKGTGDYDGDGKADVLWRHATSGENYLYPMDGTAIKASEGYLRTVPQPDWQIQYPPLPPPAPAATVVVLMPVADNTLYESAAGDLSNGAGEYLFAGQTSFTASIRRALLKFDLSGIPAGSTINAATLTLHMSRTISGALSIAVHRVLADWGEGASNALGEEGGGDPATTNDATWLHRFSSSQLWTTPGGDFTATASAATTVNGIGSYNWSGAGMVADVRQWLASPATNFGWLVRGDEAAGATSKRFDSKENPNAAFRPTLTIEFTAPPP